MNVTNLLARRMLTKSKSGFVLSVLVTAAAVSSSVTVFSVCEAGVRSFLEQTSAWGVSPFAAAWRGFEAVLAVGAQFFLYTFYGAGYTVSLDRLFSEKGAVETLPALLLLVALAALAVVFFCVKILFAVRRKERMHFYSSLLSAGAGPSFALACAGAEARVLCARGLPVGVAAGYLGVLAVNLGETVFFRAAAPGIGHERIGFSLLAGVLAAGLCFLFLLSAAKSDVKKLSVRCAAAETRTRLGANIGVSTFTPEDRPLKLFGLPHRVALRSMGDHIGKYLAVFFANAVYMSVCGMAIMSFFIVKNYGGLSSGADGAAYLLAPTVRIVSAAAAMQALAIVGSFCAMLSNFEENTGMYVLMRALGASGSMIGRAVRREGVFCVLLSGVCSTAVLVFVFCVLYNMYGGGAGLDTRALVFALAGIAAMLALFAVSVAAAVHTARRRLDKLDLIAELKEIAYS